MKKQLAVSVAALSFGAVLMSMPAHAANVLIPFLPVWDAVDETVGVGNFFSESWVAQAAGTVQITDYFVPGDNYYIFQNGVQVGATLAPDCTAYANGCDVGGPLYAATAAAGWASPLFAHWSGAAAAGDVFTIQVRTLPTGFTDSTVAITETPEPATWAMMILGFAGLGFAAYRRTQRAPAIA